MSVAVITTQCNDSSSLGAARIRDANTRPIRGLEALEVRMRGHSIAYEHGWAPHQLDKVLEVVQSQMTISDVIQPRSDAKWPLALASLLRSCFAAEKATGKGVHVSRSHAHYEGLPAAQRWDPTYTSAAIVTAIDQGVRIGLLVEQRGIRRPPSPRIRDGVQTQIALSALALELLDCRVDAGESPQLTNLAPHIELRDRGSGRFLDFNHNSWTRQVEMEMRSLDDVQRGQTLTLDGAILPHSRLIRKFNTDFHRGGRAYSVGPGTWQTLASCDRRRLYVDGEPTVEIDMCNLHLRLALALSGAVAPYELDLYDDIPRLGGVGTCDRSLMKVVCSAALSGDNREQVVHSLAEQFCELPVAPPVGAGGAKGGASSLYPFVEMLIGSLVERYPSITPLLFKDVGVTLQRTDSDLVHEIRLEIMRNHGFAPYPVHDSVIVPATATLAVTALITDVLNGQGYKIPLRVAGGPR
ncbi:hypothetical protein MTX35_24875 [Rhodococcus sp. ARC_M12]|uniref:hypothetical protein n=1 Tax=Rhodococcus sp. ARC_M12 TaxID=2928854 RepID=UPI001FB4E137|nr:hypothetical protein [Rhodococcus sp. ARC_M12]MCJ0980938.1 hypothetical protein [Rhodococcus sp. ARC_M12]